MKGYRVYSQIKQLQEKGFSKASVAKRLKINRRTVTRYWGMNAAEYEGQHISRVKLLDEYQEIILHWLTEYPTVSAAQVCDWLKEHYKADYPERTVSRYVKELREAHNLPKAQEPRAYEAVPETPPGEQMQADFGEKWLPAVGGGRVKVRFAAFVLSNSRYKYLEFQSRPFTAVDFANACRACFSYMGGVPRELVIDQDHIATISENYGDVIHTYEFEKLRQDLKFSVYLCRAADPESKGKIENVVKFVKQNFLENRVFADDSILNTSALEWLDRTGNAKLHGTTKRVPSEGFKLEREFLRPLPEPMLTGTEYICRTVRKDNTILYDSNRYSVPLGTYENQGEVQIDVKNGTLRILTVFGEFICEHMVSPGRGMLIKNQSHGRDKNEKLDRLLDSANALLGHQVPQFLRHLRYDNSRYARDQLSLIESLCGKYGLDHTLEAIRACEKLDLLRATYVKDYLKYSHEVPLPKPAALPVSDRKYHITAEKRPLDAYMKAGERR
ncbi:MAG: IS21 family transposase [Firmicutes bacterium]|nr:IS21 family transposase [Bacillota bacterium]